ncbi:MAG: thioesterase family protein [Bacillota bacterium]|nr:thioesterase family protein [Bacillota bacterium]MDW7677891.1 thioesterase family protein [Bacillota bacterium]
MHKLERGLSGRSAMQVTDDKTALAYGSGGVEVFATPAMIGLMENAAVKAVDPLLPQGYGTVGTRLDVRHMAATPKGFRVFAEAKLIEIKGNRLVFEIAAFDEVERIGEGIHERFVIEKESFLKKVEEKRKADRD